MKNTADNNFLCATLIHVKTYKFHWQFKNTFKGNLKEKIKENFGLYGAIYSMRYLLWKGLKRKLFVLQFWLWESNGVNQNRSVIDVTTNFLSILLTNIMLSAGRAASEWQIISINTVEIWVPMKMTGSSVKLLYAQKYQAYNMISKIGCPIMWAAGGRKRMLSFIHQFSRKIILTVYPESQKYYFQEA